MNLKNYFLHKRKGENTWNRKTVGTLERERERESRNLNKKETKLLKKIASVLVEEKNNKEVNNLKDINNKEDRLFYRNKVVCPLCCL